MRSTLLLLLASCIWGSAFVAQKEGGEALGPFTFGAIRFGLGALVLLPAIWFLDRTGRTKHRPVSAALRRHLLLGGLLTGLCLFGVQTCQQLGLFWGTEAGKAGFLTSTYIIMVPLLRLLGGQRCGGRLWVAVCIGLVGLWLLCMGADFTLRASDCIVLACAFACSLHILVVDRFADSVEVIRMSCMQFAVTSLLSLPLMFAFEFDGNWGALAQRVAAPEALISLLYAACLSSGVAYTLQNVAQADADPTIASVAMSFESVFAVLAGWVVLGETMSLREFAGCAVLFGALLLAQSGPVQPSISQTGSDTKV